jgi:hypothetical protein
MDLSEANAYYTRIGFAGRVGFGRKPALLVIDMNHACANPARSPIGIAMDEEIRNIRRLLDRVRAKRFPVVHTTVVIEDRDLRDGGWFVKKIPAMAAMRPGSPLAELLPEVAAAPGEVVLQKRFASAFYGTVLHSYLTRCGVDTVVVTGSHIETKVGDQIARPVDVISEEDIEKLGPQKIVEDEFPANQYPWLHLADRGVETRRLPTEGGRLDLRQLSDAIDDRTAEYRFDIPMLAGRGVQDAADHQRRGLKVVVRARPEALGPEPPGHLQRAEVRRVDLIEGCVACHAQVAAPCPPLAALRAPLCNERCRNEEQRRDKEKTRPASAEAMAVRRSLGEGGRTRSTRRRTRSFVRFKDHHHPQSDP